MTDLDHYGQARGVSEPDELKRLADCRVIRRDLKPLLTGSQTASKRVEYHQDELRRLQQDHAQIIRPDKRLWFGVAALLIFTAVGVAWPIFLMSQGPTDLAQVRLAVWSFMLSDPLWSPCSS
jgi:hypothetical protein